MAREYNTTATIPVLSRADDFGTVLEYFDVPLGNARVHDAIQTNLPGTSSSDDLGLLGSTFAYLGTGDVVGTSVTRYARLLDVMIPYQYISGETLQVLVTAMADTAQVSATVDVECYFNPSTGTVSSDLCTTSATDCNSATASEKTFAITTAALTRGGRLNLRLALIVDDTGGSGACTASITRVRIGCNTRG